MSDDMKKPGKLLKFPEHKITKPRWLMSFRNMDKSNVFNFTCSLISVVFCVILIGFMIYRISL